MNFASLTSQPTVASLLLGAGSVPTALATGRQTDVLSTGGFDAIFSASAALIDAPAAALAPVSARAPVAPSPLPTGSSLLKMLDRIAVPVTAETGSTEPVASEPVLPAAGDRAVGDPVQPAPAEFVALSVATIAMLSTLDRSATMLPQPVGTRAPAMSVVTKEEKTAATDTEASVAPADPVRVIAPLPTVALMSAVSTTNPALTTRISVAQGSRTSASVVAPKVPMEPAPLAAVRTAPTPSPALFDAIIAERRAAQPGKSGSPDNSLDAAFAATKESVDSVSTPSPTSAMIRDLASLIASAPSAVTQTSSTAPTDAIAVDRHLDLARDDAWLNDLARDIAATAATGGRLKFGLAPESLGRLDVEIRQGEAGVSVHMTTRTETARDALTAAQPRIVDEIRAQGVRVAGAEVSTDASGSGGDRPGGTPRLPLAMQIETAPTTARTLSPATTAAVADGRYA